MGIWQCALLFTYFHQRSGHMGIGYTAREAYKDWEDLNASRVRSNG